MIETLTDIKEAVEKLSGLDFGGIREAFNRCELHNWELDRDAARKRNARIKRANKKLPRGQKLKPEKMPKMLRKIPPFGDTRAVYEAVKDSASRALFCAGYGMMSDALHYASLVLRSAGRVRRIADKAEPS